MKKQIRLVSIFALLFSVFCLGITNEVSADEKERLDIQVEAGLTGQAKQLKGFPVHLTVTNNGEDFSGDLVITLPKDHQSIGNMVIPIDIAADSTKNINFSVPGMIGMDILSQGPNQTSVQQFHLYEGDWQDGNEVPINSTLELMPNYIQDNRLVIGVLTDQPDSMNYLKLMTFLGNSPELLVLEADDLPNETQGLDVLDVLVINDFSVGKLPEQTQVMLEEWVRKGGNLVVGSEPGMDQQFGALADSLPLTVNGTETVNEIKRFSELTDEAFTANNFELFTGEIDQDATIPFEENDIPLVIKQKNGKGVVTQFSYDIGHPAFSDWNGNDQLWQTIISEVNNASVNQQQMYGYGSVDEEMANISHQFPTLANFKISTLALLFIGYLLLIVPVLYFVLKKLDKREWTWIIIPSIAIISSIGLYTVGAKDRLGDIKTNTVSIISVNDQGIGNGNGSVSMLSKESGTYTLRMDNQLHPFPSGGRYISDQALSDISVIEPDGDDTNVYFRNVEFWSPRSVAINLPTKEYGHFTTGFTLADNEITGEVTNNFSYDFEEAYLLSGQAYEEIGKLAAGETKEVTLNVQKNAVFQAPNQDVAYQIYGHQTGPSSRMNDQELKTQLLSIAARQQLFTENDSPILVGFTKESLYEISVNGKETAQDNLHLITQPVSIQLAADDEGNLSTGLSAPELSVIQGNIHYNGLMEGEPYFDADVGSYQLTYDFPASFIENSFQLNEFDIDIRERQGGLTYSIYNVQTDEYEPIDQNQASFNEDVHNIYVKDQSIRFRVDASTINGPIFVPNVFIKGVTNQ